MAYKTCPDCGSRIYEYGCVNCNEEDYISMQGAYDTPEEKIPSQSIPTFITQSKIKLSAMDTYGNTKTKDISQYLHLYLGCEVEYMMEEDDIPKITRLDGKIIDEGKSCYWLKPILRPLSDMREEDYAFMNEGYNNSNKFSRHGSHEWEAEQTRYLLSKGFDLFGLIEAGLAIDKTTASITKDAIK